MRLVTEQRHATLLCETSESVYGYQYLCDKLMDGSIWQEIRRAVVQETEPVCSSW